MTRLEKFDPATLSPQQREIYDKYTTGKRAPTVSAFSLVDPDGRLEGPINAWLLSPTVGAVMEQLGAAVRFESGLSARSREIAILLVGHHAGSAFELYAHTLAARSVGLTDDDLTALAGGRPIAFQDDQERAVHAITLTLLREDTLDDAAYREGVDAIGAALLFELVVLIGYYRMIATQLSVFDVRPPATA